MTTHIIVEDAVTPQLLTSAIEAYEFDRERGSRKKDALGQIETYGLLWGSACPPSISALLGLFALLPQWSFLLIGAKIR